VYTSGKASKYMSNRNAPFDPDFVRPIAEASNKQLLIIFCKNPVIGQCKTRLGATVGDESALAIYHFLLQHTANVCRLVPVQRRVLYSHKVAGQDCWPEDIFEKNIQQGEDLGQRMAQAFADGFTQGYTNIVLIGTDLYDIDAPLIGQAFEALKTKDMVVGPAEDGGYYLMGLNHLNSELFNNKNWGTASVLRDTLSNLHPESYHLLPLRNDIDTEADLHPIDIFKPFLK
jgi:uncharacterized protein